MDIVCFPLGKGSSFFTLISEQEGLRIINKLTHAIISPLLLTMCFFSGKCEQSLKKEFYLRALDHTEQQIQARTQFREQRFYWLYVGCCAIGAFLCKSYDPASDIYRPICYAALALIQFLAIGIGWNYYSNDVKIQKLEWKKNRIFHEFDLTPPRYHEVGMGLYRNVYTALEILAICIPSLGAFLAVLLLDIALDDGTAACPCALAVHYATSLASGLILLATIAGSTLLGVRRKQIFRLD